MRAQICTVNALASVVHRILYSPVDPHGVFNPDLSARLPIGGGRLIRPPARVLLCLPHRTLGLGLMATPTRASYHAIVAGGPSVGSDPTVPRGTRIFAMKGGTVSCVRRTERSYIRRLNGRVARLLSAYGGLGAIITGTFDLSAYKGVSELRVVVGGAGAAPNCSGAVWVELAGAAAHSSGRAPRF